jgi:hypothetical protein
MTVPSVEKVIRSVNAPIPGGIVPVTVPFQEPAKWPAFACAQPMLAVQKVTDRITAIVNSIRFTFCLRINFYSLFSGGRGAPVSITSLISTSSVPRSVARAAV